MEIDVTYFIIILIFLTIFGIIFTIWYYFLYKKTEDEQNGKSSLEVVLTKKELKYFEIKNIEQKDFIYNIETWNHFCNKRLYEIDHLYYHEPCVYHSLNIVFIDFRKSNSFEYIIRNALIKLKGKCMMTFVCGYANYSFVKELCDDISENIHVILEKREVNSVSDYNKMCYDITFWEKLHGTKILIHQFDAFLINSNIEDFLSYDYVGGYWREPQNGLNVGNGGLSLRTKSVMIHILKTFKTSTIPEDLFFCKHMLKYNIGTVAPDSVAQKFAIEGEFNENLFGCHKFWLKGILFNDKL